MRTALLAGLLAAASLTTVAAAQNGPAAGQPRLIERTAFFSNPTRTGGRISPDGQWISFIAPRDGVLNVWVAPVATPDQARPLTAEKQRPIRQHFWAEDSSRILFINDKGGDENFLLYGVDVRNGEQKALTPSKRRGCRSSKPAATSPTASWWASTTATPSGTTPMS